MVEEYRMTDGDAQYCTIALERQKRIAWLVLNRPDKLNALNEEMYSELENAIDEIENDPEMRVLVITGAGRAFCAGGDLNELSRATESVEAAQKRIRLSHGIVGRLRRMKQPIIMAVNGDAVGGGCALALNGDLRVASDKARFGLTFTRVGLAPDLGSIYNLCHMVSIGKACEIVLLGNLIGAGEAARLGLVNAVVSPEELEGVARDWAAKLACSPFLSIQLTKAALYKAQNIDFASELEDEINIQSLCLTSRDGKEGIQAFLERRPPQFE